MGKHNGHVPGMVTDLNQQRAFQAAMAERHTEIALEILTQVDIACHKRGQVAAAAEAVQEQAPAGPQLVKGA